MKILCGYSGIEFNCDHFPGYLHAREIAHPIFCLPQAKLLSYSNRWASGNLSPIDSYLLFLALLRSTDQVEFRVPAARIPATDQYVANNMDLLINVVGQINIIKHPGFSIPRFVISPETKHLATVHYWIAAWEACIDDFKDGYATAKLKHDLITREAGLAKLIASAQRESSYSASLAEWAAIAGNFPTFPVDTVLGRVSCADYWKAIIRKCVKSESIFAIPAADLAELIDHCENELELHGNTFAHTLMQLLRAGQQRQNGYLDLGEFDIRSGTYAILSGNDTVEDANKIAMIQSAPESLPTPEQYPSRIAYLRAKAKWDMAQAHNQQSASGK
jgi:hypothetical protein